MEEALFFFDEGLSQALVEAMVIHVSKSEPVNTQAEYPVRRAAQTRLPTQSPSVETKRWVLPQPVAPPVEECEVC